MKNDLQEREREKETEEETAMDGKLLVLNPIPTIVHCGRQPKEGVAGAPSFGLYGLPKMQYTRRLDISSGVETSCETPMEVCLS